MGNFWASLETLPLALRIGESWWFPLLESLHVLTAMFVVGSILMVDLRLLGLTARRYPIKRFANEILPWTWTAFVFATLTGLGMFITRASWYIENRAFQLKLLALFLAAVNMAIFHSGDARSIARWESSHPSVSARAAGAVSIAIWIGITLAGRWTGHLV